MKALRSSMKKKALISRRPEVRRGGVVRQWPEEEPSRYLKGVEAAEMFELDDTRRDFADRMAEESRERFETPFVVFVRKYRRMIAAALIMLVIGSAVIYGVNVVKNLYTDETIFITDEEAAGKVTITERLTTSNEMSEKVSYFLLVGVDDSSLLTDCIWLMCYDIAGNNATVMQIPRDTYVGFKDSPGTAKINGVYASPRTVRFCEKCGVTPPSDEIADGFHTKCGTELSKVKESNINALIRVINTNLGLPVDHFVIFNFAGFAKIINAMGGVDVHLEYRVHDPAIDVGPGDVHLEGWPAVDFMRSRKGFTEGDIGRVKNQRVLIDAMMNQALSMDLTSMLSLVTKCSDCFQSDMALDDIVQYATVARSLDVSKLEMFEMPGYDHWVRPNPSYYVCDETKTAAAINEKLLPYGLPDGSICSAETVNFPDVEDKLGGGSDDDDDDDPPANTTAATEGTTKPTEGTTKPTEGTTKPTEGTTKPTEGTTKPTEGTTKPTQGTTKPTDPPTQAPTDPPTQAPTDPPTQATTTFQTLVEEVIYENANQQYTPLSDPRSIAG